jgi:RNA polymerase-interacting CarD/CdnL/TRCF family regulator
MSFQRLQPGDRISHPTYGLGVVEGTTTFNQGGRATEFYSVRLARDSLLTVPVDRAEALGLRLIVNGLAAIVACLHTPMHPLPDNDRERFIWLKACWNAPQPEALTEGVRDLTGRGRTYRLTPADKRWLVNASERMSVEVAMVDAIEVFQAREAVQREIESLKSAVA